MVVKRLQINTLVNISFFTVILLVFILMIVNQISFSKIETDSLRVTSLRAPTAKASASMNTALNRSLAALRGWMLLEEDRFLISRRNAWQIIRQDEKKLNALSVKWTNPKNQDRFSKIGKFLDKLEEEQTKIELLTHKLENVHSSEILFNTAVPLATSISDNITKMIDYTKVQQPSSKRLTLLSAMADFRGSFALSLADIRAFLLSAEEKFKTSFELHWNMNDESYKRLTSLTEHLTPFERSLLNDIKKLRATFEPLPVKMFVSRQSEDWNRANYLLKTTAVKTSQDLIETLKEMVSDQNNLLEIDAELLSKEVEKVKIFQAGFLGFCLLATVYFSVIINRKYRSFLYDLDKRSSIIDQNVLMATLDNTGGIINISNALCRTLGGTQKDFIGTQSHYFLSVDNDSEQKDTILKSLLTGQTWQGELKRNTMTGEEIWLSSSIIPITKGDDGGVYHNILEDITDRKRIEEVSITDKLTSLFNRRKFDEVIENEIKLARRRGGYFSMAIIDIDFFKKYNDHYGHPQGDTALQRTASVLRSSLNRPDDYVFRLGGEEFAIIFNSLDEKKSFDMLESIRKNVEQLKIEHIHNEVSDYITISIGVKVCIADNLIDKDAIYNEADRLLYTAKEKRNTVVVG